MLSPSPNYLVRFLSHCVLHAIPVKLYDFPISNIFGDLSSLTLSSLHHQYYISGDHHKLKVAAMSKNSNWVWWGFFLSLFIYFFRGLGGVIWERGTGSGAKTSNNSMARKQN